MIAKRIPRTKGTSSAARLVRYMVAAQGGIEPETWERTADYILATGSKTQQGERVASFRVTNCGTDDPAHATTIIQAIQKANTRSKADKTYHLVYSFPPGETPPLDVLHAIEDELCAAIGFADHQRISAVHIDTDHLHVHVAINKVHPTGLQNIEPYFDKQRLMEACERLEIQHGLQRTNHGLVEGKAQGGPHRIRLAPEQQPHERDTRFRAYLRESYSLALAELPEATTRNTPKTLLTQGEHHDRRDSIRLGRREHPSERDPAVRRRIQESYNLALGEPPEAKTLHGLRNLSSCRLAHAGKGSPVLLPSDARHGVEQRGKELLDGLRRAGNGDRADAGGRSQRLGSRTADMEAHSAVESLTSYVAREVAPALRKATSWKEVHEALGAHGLEIKPRGAGLVIGDPGLQLWTKAGNAGRDLSFKPLTDRLGRFEPVAGIPPQPRQPYQARPMQQHPSSAALFAEYQRQKQARLVARRQGMERIKAERESYRAQLKSWQATQRMMLRVSGKGATRKVMAAMTKQQADTLRAGHRKAAAANRQQLVAATTMPTWADWLAQQATQGNLDALAILRSREEKAERMRGDLLTAERAEKAKTIVLDALRPHARKDGAVAYSTIDGGKVIDRKTYVQAQRATTGAALVALSLAEKRFQGQPLIVEGSEQFRQEVAQLAAIHGFAVRFADPQMEQARQAAIAARPQPVQLAPIAQEQPPSGAAVPPKPAEVIASLVPSATQQKPAESPSAAVVAWIASRNALREKTSSLDYNRLWQPSDAGRAIYQGRRRMEDGSEILLLKRGAEMLVKPSSPRVVAKASRWKIGSTVEVDVRGRFKDTSQSRGL